MEEQKQEGIGAERGCTHDHACRSRWIRQRRRRREWGEVQMRRCCSRQSPRTKPYSHKETRVCVINRSQQSDIFPIVTSS